MEAKTMNMYITADMIGIQTGGGLVTKHELDALKSIGDCEVVGCGEIVAESICGEIVADSIKGTFVPVGDTVQPWYEDAVAVGLAGAGQYRLAHFYAGTFTKTVGLLKSRGTRVTYTAAAHDVRVSREEHEKLGLAYNYPHLTDPEQFKRYVGGYLMADCLICPSKHSADTMRGFGAHNRIEVIPHGCDLPEHVTLPPGSKVVGYLGAVGPDKGLVYLLQAWAMVNAQGGTLLIAGRDSTSPFVAQLVEATGAKNVVRLGWVDDASDFYNRIDVLVQPSASEGFGCEVLEALAHGRPVICSDGAGAADVVIDGWVVPARDAGTLAGKIERTLGMPNLAEVGAICRRRAADFTWDKIKQRYVDVWRGLL